MKTDSYFFKATTYKGNRLVEAACKFVGSYDNCVVSNDYLPTLERDLIEKIDELNEKFPRCRPLELSRHKLNDGFVFSARAEGECEKSAFLLSATEVQAFYN